MREGDEPVLARPWTRSPSVHAVELDGEALLYDPPSGRVHHLNTSAWLIWTCLDEDVTGAEIAAELAEAFEIPLSVISAQVAQILETMALEGLVIG